MSTARFSIIPGWVVTDSRLKGKDLQVLCLLGRHTDKFGWCRRSQVKMAEELSCARSTVQASLDRLAEIGAVERHAEESRDGRDSAHWYRVIHDPKVAQKAFDLWEGEEFAPNEEPDAADTHCRQAGTPAGTSAPPAGPEPAPPAGPGSAPINEPLLTPPLQQGERERARGDQDEEENPKALERRLRQWWKTWPSFATDEEMRVRRAWLALTPQQRRDCELRTPDYLAKVKQIGRSKPAAASTYLQNRLWERLDAPAAATTGVCQLHKPFSKEWQGAALAALLGPEAPLPPMTLTNQRIASQNETAPQRALAEKVRRDHRARYAWPRVTALYSDARERRGALVDAATAEACESFRSYHVQSPEALAWARLYVDRGWPWPDLGTHEWLCFPATAGGTDADVDAALAAFERALSGDRTGDDADQA